MQATQFHTVVMQFPGRSTNQFQAEKIRPDFYTLSGKSGIRPDSEMGYAVHSYLVNFSACNSSLSSDFVQAL